MIIDVKLPQLGESVAEGTVSKWLVREGDVVKKDQPLVEIGTDKADSELPSPAAGRVVKLLAKEGDVLPVHALLCQIEEGAFSTTAASPVAPPASGPVPAALADAGRSATGAALATPHARKAALEHDVDLNAVRGSGEFGRITRDDVMRARGDGNGSSQSAPQPTTATVPAAPVPAPAPAPAPRVAAAPVRELAQMIQQGGGFVPPIPGVGYGSFKVPGYRQNEGDTVVPFTRRRRITADHMTYSKFASPHVVTVAEVDLHRVSQLREQYKDAYKKEGMSLTMLAFVCVATARALRENRSLNARVLDDAYVLLKDINLGVAVDSPDGLVVPVVRRADELGIRGMVRGVDDLAKRAKSGKITIDDLSGASFSVSNPGLKGNLFGGAIINQPNVGILRMGEIQKRVVVVEGPNGEDLIAIHPLMYMALSYDHRIVDGVAANSFLWRVTEILEKGEFEV
jgi:2-oxoglutarate dehydrogenase E2 component (dihydrolipoamide succinyltransferase)